jgi:hypothetical protein
MMVYVDENDVFDDISDKLLIAELKRRKIGLSENTVDMDLARFAYEELRGGRVASAMAEGIEGAPSQGWRCYLPKPSQQTHWADPRESFRTLWESINGLGAWDANPWVVAVSFRTVRENIDSIKGA